MFKLIKKLFCCNKEGCCRPKTFNRPDMDIQIGGKYECENGGIILITSKEYIEEQPPYSTGWYYHGQPFSHNSKGVWNQQGRAIRLEHIVEKYHLVRIIENAKMIYI